MTRDTIEIREYERRQLVEFLPQAVAVYEEHDLPDDAERIEELSKAFAEEPDENVAEYDLGGDAWNEIADALDELDETRASWLRAKIGRRAELSVVKMGFTTEVPIGVLMSGQKPTRAD